MHFFQKFPSIPYTLTEGISDTKITRNIPNMTVKLVMDILETPSIQYSVYNIVDKDRPDTVAAKLYGGSRYAWVILLANNMKDWYDWPLTDSEFYEYMNKKYETVQGANDGYNASRTTDPESTEYIWKYIWIVSTGQEIEVDKTFYDTLSPLEKKIINFYDYEYQLNDKKREIRVPTMDSLNIITTRLNELLSS